MLLGWVCMAKGHFPGREPGSFSMEGHAVQHVGRDQVPLTT